MNCKIFNCEGVAKYPYPACGIRHGVELRDTLKDLKAYQNMELSFSDFYMPYGWKSPDMTLEKIIYYAKLV